MYAGGIKSPSRGWAMPSQQITNFAWGYSSFSLIGNDEILLRKAPPIHKMK
jgi:hypothetical protein